MFVSSAGTTAGSGSGAGRAAAATWVERLRSSAFIGLPCPKNAAGRGSVMPPFYAQDQVTVTVPFITSGWYSQWNG
jgi:hypothetical protein